MSSWRENVDSSIKEHLEAQIRETTKYQSTYNQAGNPQNAQLWIAIANLSKQILNLNLKVKYMERVIRDTIEQKQKEPEPISYVFDNNVKSAGIEKKKPARRKKAAKKNKSAKRKKGKIRKKR